MIIGLRFIRRPQTSRVVNNAYAKANMSGDFSAVFTASNSYCFDDTKGNQSCGKVKAFFAVKIAEFLLI